MSEEEEAELLARALEGGEQTAEIADALETAEAVRMRRAALLEKERALAVLQVVERRIARARKKRWLFASGGGALAAAAAAVLVFTEMKSSESAPVASAPVATAPAAPQAASEEAAGGSTEAELSLARVDLLAMQRGVAEGRSPYSQSDSVLDQYRALHWAALKRRYE